MTENFNVHGGIGFFEYRAKQVHPCVFPLLTTTDGLREAEQTVDLAWKAADEHLSPDEAETLDRRTLAVAFLAYNFADMMHSEDGLTDAMMYVGYALAKITEREHLIVLYNAETMMFRIEPVSGSHDKAMAKIQGRRQTISTHDFAGWTQEGTVDGQHRTRELSVSLNAKTKH
jgi:hypothetical protein